MYLPIRGMVGGEKECRRVSHNSERCETNIEGTDKCAVGSVSEYGEKSVTGDVFN